MTGTPTSPAQPWTVARLLQWTVDHFTTCGLDEPRLAAEILLAHALKQPRIRLYTDFESVPPDDARAAFRELVRKASAHTPVAYLVGQKEFYSLSFSVTPDVLIPRPETEALVEKAIELAGQRADQPFRVADIGTGSGCIAVAIAAHAPNAHVLATDIAEAALDVARGNAVSNEVADRITFVQADGLEIPRECAAPGGFDLIVSNPPYVAEDEMAGLPKNVRDHEPRSALTPGGDGLAMYRRIAGDAPAKLAPAGQVLVEIGADRRDAVLAVFGEAGSFAHVGTYKNPSDPHDRVLHFARLC